MTNNSYTDDFNLDEEINQETVKKQELENEVAKNNPYNLPDELIKLGYKNDNEAIYVPYTYRDPEFDTEFPEYYLKISKQPKHWTYTWSGANENGIVEIAPDYSKNKAINVVDKDRNRILGQYSLKCKLPRGDEVIKDFLMDTETTLSRYKIPILIDPDFELPTDEADEDEEIADTWPYPDFKTYPEIIQKEAVKQINDGSFLDNLLYVTGLKHYGNSKQIILTFYSYASIIIKTPQHQQVGGKTGEGKTDLVMETLDQLPDNIVHALRTISPKNIYYDKDSYSDGINIVFFDDVDLNKLDNIEVLKELSDNKKAIKELKTVKDGKALTFRLPGSYLVIMTMAKENPDNELLDRFFLNNLIGEIEDKSNVKSEIKNNVLEGKDNDPFIKNMQLINKASFQFLIEKDLKVFNPFSLFLNVDETSNRNIKGIMGYILSRSLFFYGVREVVKPDPDEDLEIIIGNQEDYINATNLWEEDKARQDHKISATQEEILNLLEYKTEEDIEKIQTDVINDSSKIRYYQGVENTAPNISKKLGIAKNTVYTNFNGQPNGTQLGLIQMGLADSFKITEDNHRNGSIYYLSKKGNEEIKGNSLNSVEDLNIVTINGLWLGINDPDYKRKLLTTIITIYNILITREIIKYTENYVSSETHELDTYEKLVEYINNFIKDLPEKIRINNDNFLGLEDLKIHAEYKKKIDVCFNSFLLEFKKNIVSNNLEETALNDEPDENSYTYSNYSQYVQHENTNEERTKEIEKKVYEFLKKHDGQCEKKALMDSLEFDRNEDLDFIVQLFNNLVKKEFIKDGNTSMILLPGFKSYHDKDLIA